MTSFDDIIFLCLGLPEGNTPEPANKPTRQHSCPPLSSFEESFPPTVKALENWFPILSLSSLFLPVSSAFPRQCLPSHQHLCMTFFSFISLKPFALHTRHSTILSPFFFPYNNVPFLPFTATLTSCPFFVQSFITCLSTMSSLPSWFTHGVITYFANFIIQLRYFSLKINLFLSSFVSMGLLFLVIYILLQGAQTCFSFPSSGEEV